MTKKLLRCVDPVAAWPPGLVKEYDERVADMLLQGPYYIEITNLSSYNEAEATARALKAAQRLALVQEPCKSCREKRERIARAKALKNMST